MRSRCRAIAALFALIALTASMAEQAWAVACIGMEGHSAIILVESDPELASVPDAATHEHPVPGPHRSPSPANPVPCPVAAVLGGACGAAVLPTATISGPVGQETRLFSRAAEDEAPVALAPFSLFRPPRP